MNTSDMQTYLDRIHASPASTVAMTEPSLALLRALHEAHMLAVPFENLSIHYGQPIILQEALLYDKIVRRRRGGFCYELNGLFAWLLRSLGYSVSLLSAGVAGADGTYSPEFDHLTLLIQHVEGADWLADVGFGDSFRRPLRFASDIEQDGGDGHLYRLHRDDTPSSQPEEPRYPSWIVQQLDKGQWQPQYRFTLQPHALADFDERCHFQQTSPDSHFTQRRICSLALPDGRITLSDLRFISTMQSRREERVVASESAYLTLLAERFGIVI